MNDTQIPNTGGEKALFIKSETFELIRTAARGTILPDLDHFTSEKKGNQTHFSLLHPLPNNPAEGDMLYYADGEWKLLEAPAAGSILYHDGSIPVWLTPSGSGTKVLTTTGPTPAWTATSECGA